MTRCWLAAIASKPFATTRSSVQATRPQTCSGEAVAEL